MPAFPRKKKEAFADLPKDWRAKYEDAKDDEIRAEAGKVAFNEVANQACKAGDQHLAEMAEAHKEAGAQYAEATKSNKEKLSFLRHILEGRGKEESLLSLMS